jgi:hypothetical protein
MALTVIERKILEAARTAISKQHQSYVCLAIKWATVEGNKAKVAIAKRRLTCYVDGLLEGHLTLGDWLRSKCNGDWQKFDHLPRALRVAWITWMLGEPVVIDETTRKQFEDYMNPSTR